MYRVLWSLHRKWTSFSFDRSSHGTNTPFARCSAGADQRIRNTIGEEYAQAAGDEYYSRGRIFVRAFRDSECSGNDVSHSGRACTGHPAREPRE
jgi:hypothetical protein